MYILVDNLLPFLVAGEGGVAHGAHIGGFIAGAIAAVVIERTGWSKQPADIDPDPRPTGTGDVRVALADGRYAEAAQAYFALPEAEAERAISPDEAVALAQWLREHGHPDAALTLLLRVIRARPRAAGIAEAHALAGSVLLREMGEPTEAFQHLPDRTRPIAAAGDAGAHPPGARCDRRPAEEARGPAEHAAAVGVLTRQRPRRPAASGEGLPSRLRRPGAATSGSAR